MDYLIESCDECGKKSFIVLYDTVEDGVKAVITGEDKKVMFVWRCPICDSVNKLPIATVVNATSDYK